MAEEETAILPLSAGELLEQQETLTFKDRQEGIVGTLAEPDDVRRFTHIARRVIIPIGKIIYFHKDIEEMERCENDGGEYRPPDFVPNLVMPHLNLQVSQDGFLIKVYKSISHLVESAVSGARGLLGRRRSV